MHMHMHNTRPFSKTHLLMLAMEGAENRRNRLILVKHTHMHNTRLFIKTHRLMLAMEGADKERNRQGEKQTRRETGYFWSNINTCTKQDHSVKLTR